MPKVLDIRQSEEPRDVIHQIVESLAHGGVVGLPTESDYVAAAYVLKPEAVARLCALPTSSNGGAANAVGRPALGIRTGSDAIDYLPDMSRLGRKLIRRCWPGPVALRFPVPSPSTTGLLPAFAPACRSAVTDEGWIEFRAPHHGVIQEVQNLLPAPLVLRSAPRSGDDSIPNAEAMSSVWGEELSLVIDDGPVRYPQGTTVIDIESESWKLLVPGVVTETTVARLASEVLLFVCTGNTCRSPMAEALFRRLLAERLQCRDEELCDRGFVVLSAGLAAPVGQPASQEAVELLEARQIDLGVHESQPLTDRLLDQADRIFTMTAQHRRAIVEARPETADRIQLLSRDGHDVTDPMGGGMDEYEACLQEIEANLRQLVEELETG